jgi:hypothetical protein
MAEKGAAFVKGGCGCLVAFLVIGLLVALLGGRVNIDIGGAIALFVIGGILGLIVLAVYNKGRRDAIDGGSESDPLEDQPPLEPPQ